MMKVGVVVSFLLPESIVDEDYLTDRSESVRTSYEDLLVEISKKFGGYTITPGLSGGWVDDDGDLLVDSNIRLDVSVVSQEGKLRWLYTEIVKFARSIDEQALYIGIGGKSYILDLDERFTGDMDQFVRAVYFESLHDAIHAEQAHSADLPYQITDSSWFRNIPQRRITNE